MPVELWNYNMCDVAPRPGHSRQSRGGDDGDTVTVTQQHPARGRTARPGHARPSPGQEHRGRGDGIQQHLVR